MISFFWTKRANIRSWKLVAADKKSVGRQKSRDMLYIIPSPLSPLLFAFLVPGVPYIFVLVVLMNYSHFFGFRKNCIKMDLLSKTLKKNFTKVGQILLWYSHQSFDIYMHINNQSMVALLKYRSLLAAQKSKWIQMKITQRNDSFRNVHWDNL